jgi:hypothetical protein
MNNISYNNNEYDISLRQSYSKWIINYSIENYGVDWKYILGLTYRKTIKNYNSSIKNVKRLYNCLVDVDSTIDGFVSTEADGGFSNLHHHLVINCEIDYDRLKNEINKVWGKIGIIDLKVYDRDRNYCYYMCKHLNKCDFNNLEILSKLDLTY